MAGIVVVFSTINRCVYIRTMDLICTRLSGMEAGIQVPRRAPPMAIHIRVNWIPVSLPGRRRRSNTAITYATIEITTFFTTEMQSFLHNCTRTENCCFLSL